MSEKFSINGIYQVFDRKTSKILCEGTVENIADYLNVSESTIIEHFKDRNVPNRFSNCYWRIERVM